MKIYIRDTAQKKKVEFKPLDENNVRLYVCGPTIYDNIHLGNTRPQIIFDTLFRTLKHFYPTTYVKNVTDVDDKIIKRANEEGISTNDLVVNFYKKYKRDFEKINFLPASVEPRATDHIQEMIAIIEQLIKNGHAYATEDGNVLFSVETYQDYGKLSHRKVEDLLAGERIAIEEYKKSPADFILWKPAKEGEPYWESPWGNGRPGWHIECSAMSSKYLGKTFDIHAGGNDLLFPHHENEVAQSVCCNGKGSFAQYWMHNGMLNVNGEKMSKSLGNFFTLNEILEKYHGEVVRFYFLSTHYHQPMNWTDDGLEIAKKTLDKIYNALLSTKDIHIDKLAKPREDFLEALCDDLNTPKAISILHEMTTELNKNPNEKIKSELLASADLLGILKADPEKWFTGLESDNSISEDEINKLVQERTDAKKNKDYQLADDIRNKLDKDFGIILEDKPEGTIWKKK
jgi:cysteinyl-tRNA synthetase